MNMHKLSKKEQEKWIHGDLPLSVIFKNWLLKTLTKSWLP